MTNPNLPAAEAVENAPLPARYEAAKAALRACVDIDECKDWRDKAAALATYAKMAEDVEMEKFANRIRLRANRRVGELLQEFDARGRNEGERISRTQAAEDAGLSHHQRVTAIRIAQVPEEQFEEAVESQRPPGLSIVAAMGKMSRPSRADAASSVTSAELSAMMGRLRAADVINAFVQIGKQCDPAVFVEVLTDEQNLNKVDTVNKAIAFVLRLKDTLAAHGLRQQPRLKAVTPGPNHRGE